MREILRGGIYFSAGLLIVGMVFFSRFSLKKVVGLVISLYGNFVIDESCSVEN